MYNYQGKKLLQLISCSPATSPMDFLCLLYHIYQGRTEVVSRKYSIRPASWIWSLSRTECAAGNGRYGFVADYVHLSLNLILNTGSAAGNVRSWGRSTPRHAVKFATARSTERLSAELSTVGKHAKYQLFRTHNTSWDLRAHQTSDGRF